MTFNDKRNIDNFIDLFLNDTPMMDVRAPVEFSRGAFPCAVNLPLLNDEERAAVGTAYKKQGKDAAVALGHSLVCGDVKERRVKMWVEFAKQNPEGCLFCFRGGMRSHITQSWMKDAGVDYPLVTGGYKKLRRFLVDSLDEIVNNEEFVIISGRTGVGKTIVINALPNAVDLEKRANHRGSSFGGKVNSQPSQIDFENAVAIDLLKLTQKRKSKIFIEDESRIVGRCGLPLSLFRKMQVWPIVVLEDTLENRIENIKQEYVANMLAAYEGAYDDAGFDNFAKYLLDSLARTKRRLGLERYKEIDLLLRDALSLQQETGDTHLHEAWIKAMLINYYDPMYDYQLSLKNKRIIFKGRKEEVLEYCGANVI